MLFWNYFSAPYLKSLVQKHSTLSFHLAAADLINWEMAGPDFFLTLTFIELQGASHGEQ